MAASILEKLIELTAMAAMKPYELTSKADEHTDDRLLGSTPKEDEKSKGRYGALEHLSWHGEAAVKSYAIIQYVMVGVLGAWLLCLLGHRIMWFSGLLVTEIARELGPSPSPAGHAAQLVCKAYTYPQCEDALQKYIGAGARSRCEAFERVKSEGDFVQFPYLLASESRCTTPGCCGCPGQCSKCPPLLPDCSSWQIDGTWKVAFDDGSNAKYNFDAHGHYEVEFPVGSLPAKWKPYDSAYIPAGNDIPGYPQWLTLPEAEDLCTRSPDCHGVTFNVETKKHDGRYQMWLKSVTGIVMMTGCPWRTLVNEQHPPLSRHAAIAGPLVQVNATGRAVSFRFDLHKAAPQFFPEDSSEVLSLVDGELLVVRRIRGIESHKGTGVQVRS